MNKKIKDLKIEWIAEFDACIESLKKINEFIHIFLKMGNLGDSVFFDFKLAIEEIFINIIEHGLMEQQNERISIELKIDRESVEVQISDNGKMFNPLTISDPDFEDTADMRSLGGIGIFLMKQSVDNVEYRRAENRNILTIKKHLIYPNK